MATKGINKRVEWISNMEKELERLQEGRKVKIHIDSHRTTLKKYRIGKGQAMMAYMDFSLKNSLPSMIDELSK